MPAFKDLAGKTFGRLTAKHPKGKQGGEFVWKCVCECGNTTEVRTGQLSAGKVQSCGCLQRESTKKANTKHGHAPFGKKVSPTYSVWRSMIIRCHDVTCRTYRYYGGRGIKVCDRWLGDDGFEMFLRDIGERPSVKHTIDRKDNALDYTPDNCQWSTRDVQDRNKSNNVWIEYGGERLVAADWAKRLGTSTGTIRGRMKLGWPTERVLTEPVHRGK